jgi:hypothetical protein
LRCYTATNYGVNMYYDHFKNRPYPDNDGNSHDIEFFPCPFCGDAPHVMPKGNRNTNKRSVTVKCKTCRIERTDAALNHGFDWLYKVAAESWNKRTDAV